MLVPFLLARQEFYVVNDEAIAFWMVTKRSSNISVRALCCSNVLYNPTRFGRTFSRKAETNVGGLCRRPDRCHARV